MPVQLQRNQWWLHDVNGEPAVLFHIDKIEVDDAGVSWVTYMRYMGGKPPQCVRLKEHELAVITGSKRTRQVPDPAEISKFLMLWGNFGG